MNFSTAGMKKGVHNQSGAYSHRNATRRSTFVARRAGMWQASKATNVSSERQQVKRAL